MSISVILTQEVSEETELRPGISLGPNPCSDDQLPEPERVPIGEPGSDISLEEAEYWARRSGFLLKTPEEAKDKALSRIVMDEPRWDSAANDLQVDVIQLIFHYGPRLNLNVITLNELLSSGDYMIIVSKGSINTIPPVPDEGYSFRTLCMYSELIASLRWVDGTTAYEILASADHFSKLDLIEIAESME